MVFDQCRATLDPVAVVVVGDAVDLLHQRVVDVAANHAVGTPSTCLRGQIYFEIPNQGDAVEQPVLEKRGERPVSQADTAARAADELAGAHAGYVEHAAHAIDPVPAMDAGLMLVTVHDQ